MPKECTRALSRAVARSGSGGPDQFRPRLLGRSFPTILEACGVALPQDRPIDGLSLLPHLRSGGKTPLARDELVWHFPHYRHDPGPYSIIRKGDWKLIKFWDGPRELYNLRYDLEEETNLADQLPGMVAHLEALLDQRLESQEARLPRPNPDFAGS
jgi:arylsulfatase A